MQKSTDVYNYRKDYRSKKQFKYQIAKLTAREEQYFRIWLRTQNLKRKKIAITAEHWGNNANGNIVYDLEELKGFCRPDFIINRLHDNSRIVRLKQPIEVQTSSIKPKKCYIKKSKIEWPYDDITKEVCDKECAILFICNTSFKGNELYFLLQPTFLKKISKNGIEYPDFLGRKPCYYFNFDDVEWKPLFNHTKEERLDLWSKKSLGDN
jgi:hypothetical protein